MNTQPAGLPGSATATLEFAGRPLLQLEPMNLFGQLRKEFRMPAGDAA